MGDLIEVYKVIQNMNKVNPHCLSTQGKGLLNQRADKIKGESFKKDLKGNISTQRVCLYQECAATEEATVYTIMIFKSYLDRYMDRKASEGYIPSELY